MLLHDCVCKNPSEVELFIVGNGPPYEAAKIGRDRTTQAVLGIDKTIDSSGEIDEVLANEQCQSLIATLGIGVQFSLDTPLDMQRLRYGRVILATEESEEGLHIRSEVLRLFYTYSRQILEGGHGFAVEANLEPGFTQEEFDAQVLNAETRHLKAP